MAQGSAIACRERNAEQRLLLLTTHWFLDRIATHILAFEGDSQRNRGVSSNGSRAISRTTRKTKCAAAERTRSSRSESSTRSSQAESALTNAPQAYLRLTVRVSLPEAIHIYIQSSSPD